MTASPIPASDGSTRQLGRLRRVVDRGAARWRRVVAVEAVCILVAAPLFYLWLLFLADGVLHLPGWARLAASGVFLAGLAWLGVRVVRRWRAERSQLTEDHVALAIEKQAPGGMENRLINALQLARLNGDADGTRSVKLSRAYRDAILHENVEALRQLEMGPPVRFKRVLLPLLIAVAAIGVGVGFWQMRPEHFQNAASRLFLPLADIEPIYRTRLNVEPGNVEVEPGRSVAVRVYIEGEVPDELTLRHREAKAGALWKTTRLRVASGKSAVTHVFENLRQDTEYQVLGGDYTAPRRGAYQLGVLTQPRLSVVNATLIAPAYTQRPPEKIKSNTGDLEALHGSTAQATFHFDQQVTSATLRLLQGKQPGETLAMSRESDEVWAAKLPFSDASRYQIDVAYEGGRSATLGPYRLRVIADQPPTLRLQGIEAKAGLDMDAVTATTASAEDDLGLGTLELCVWPIDAEAFDAPQPTVPEGEPMVLKRWDGGRKADWSAGFDLFAPQLQASEGDRFMVALRGRDHDPAKADQWTHSQPYPVRVLTEGATLQLVYDQLLKTETSISIITEGLDDAQQGVTSWLVKLDGSSGLRWDDAGNIKKLNDGMAEQAKALKALREKLVDASRQTAPPAASLQLSLSLLADTELIRSVRIVESVAGRDDPQAMRVTLAEARTILQRINKSLEDMLGQHIAMRYQWERSHMVPYTQMLAQRQALLASASQRYAQSAPAKEYQPAVRASMHKRQSELVRLSGLASRAFAGLSRRVGDDQPLVTAAFTDASAALRDKTLLDTMRAAATDAKAGSWSPAADSQSDAAAKLEAIHAALRDAQQQAADEAISKMQQPGEVTVEDQGEIADLPPGTTIDYVTGDAADAAKQEIVREGEPGGGGDKFGLPDEKEQEASNFEGLAAAKDSEGKDIPSDFSILRLADKPGNTLTIPGGSDREATAGTLKTRADEVYEDLVGDLLDEADDLRDQWETFSVASKAQGGVEEGEIGKSSGDLASMSAVAATGNMKPPPSDYGGGSMGGRGGGRAHGEIVGDEIRSMRGTDTAMQGQERTADQEGTIKEVMTDDPQTDFAVGYGGKKMDSDDPQSFSTKDAGKWTDDMAEGLGEARDTHKIVERMGDPLSPEVAAMLRDLEGDQEQVMERIKTIRKQFNELFLPTDQLDELAAQLAANLDRLKESPDPEVFRQQLRALDRLMSIATVYNQAGSGFRMSLNREQRLKGPILDEAVGATLPGYEDAAERYYKNLSKE